MNCEYCGTKLFAEERSCSKCGAPNDVSFEVKLSNHESVGVWLADMEKYEPVKIDYNESTKDQSEWAIIQPKRIIAGLLLLIFSPIFIISSMGVASGKYILISTILLVISFFTCPICLAYLLKSYADSYCGTEDINYF
jgi:hypothetical protein